MATSSDRIIDSKVFEGIHRFEDRNGSEGTIFHWGSEESEIWITSKLWCSDHAPEDVSKALSKSFENLQLDYIDLYLAKTNHAWAAMEGLYASGQARAIGVSNFSTKKLQDLLTYAKVPLAVNQEECHPVWQQLALHNLCKSTGVHLSVTQFVSGLFESRNDLSTFKNHI